MFVVSFFFSLARSDSIMFFEVMPYYFSFIFDEPYICKTFKYIDQLDYRTTALGVYAALIPKHLVA
jgi:hypothetical protein